MDFKVHILGTGSATPSLRHMPSSQVVEHNGKLFMIDCGEGTQLQMMRMRLKFGKLNNIFISHIHGDHILGVLGLISTMALHEKGSALTIHIIQEGADIIKSLLATLIGDTPFNLNFDIIDPQAKQQLLFEDSTLTVSSFPLFHRVPTVGFLFREKPKPRHINGEMARFHQVPHYMMEQLRQGADFIKPDGTVIPNSLLTTPPSPSTSYAYCTDTIFSRRVVASVRGVDTIFHDSTYGDDGLANAAKYGHSTSRQAAEVALRADANTLILGHFSQRYDSEEKLVEQAAEVFPGRIIAANEGMTIEL
ncbi:MAG: ribonuclease Z [Bacteroides sp.]|nr:ribonuclease Z [Bacteroides sp.]MCM1379167.1 ribonuclease Z [Bacteroides sp.]MCM1445184.1 ribonuclease Z [Prevotella sp.]